MGGSSELPASSLCFPQTLLLMSQLYTQEQLAALRQQQYMLQLQQQQQQQAQYSQAPQQQQPHYQMGTSQYYQATQQPQPKSVQLTLPADACPGRSYEFEAEGRMLSFQVPQGYGPGMQITVSY